MLAQLDRYKKQMIKLKFQVQKDDERKKRFRTTLKPNASQFQIELELKKTNLIQEMQGNTRKLSKMRVTGTNFRITESMNREDRKTNMDLYLKER